MIGPYRSPGTRPVYDDGAPAPKAPTGAAVGILVSLALSMVLTGCVAMQHLFGSPVPGDLTAIYSCVVGQIDTGDTNVADIMVKCDREESQLVLDIVDTLTKSPQFQQDHPTQVGALRAQVAARRPVDAGAP